MRDGTGWLEKRERICGEPKVRIHLPPAGSQVRTRTHDEIERIEVEGFSIWCLNARWKAASDWYPASSATAPVDLSDAWSALAATVMRMSVSRSLAERPRRS